MVLHFHYLPLIIIRCQSYFSETESEAQQFTLGDLNERRGDWATAILKSPLCAHKPQAVNDKVPRKKSVLSGHRNCFLGMEICISFFICPKIMLWVDFQELASKKRMMIMRQKVYRNWCKPFAEYLWRSTLYQAHGEHKHAFFFFWVGGPKV